MIRRRTLLLLLFLLQLAVASLPRTVQGQVLSVTGTARAEGKALQEGEILNPGVVLELSDASVIQLLLQGQAVSIVGPARVKLLDGETTVVVLQAEAIQLAGTGGTLIAQGWRLTLDKRGGTALLDRQRIYLLRGKAELRALAPSALGLFKSLWPWLDVGAPEPKHGMDAAPQRRLRPDSPEACLLGEGQLAELGWMRGLRRVQANPDPSLLRLIRTFRPPGLLPEGGISVQEVHRARQRQEDQQRSRQEVSACGCTESRGGGVSPTGGTSSTTPLEGTHATLKLRVEGIPRGVK